MPSGGPERGGSLLPPQGPDPVDSRLSEGEVAARRPMCLPFCCLSAGACPSSRPHPSMGRSRVPASCTRVPTSPIEGSEQRPSGLTIVQWPCRGGNRPKCPESRGFHPAHRAVWMESLFLIDPNWETPFLPGGATVHSAGRVVAAPARRPPWVPDLPASAARTSTRGVARPGAAARATQSPDHAASGPARSSRPDQVGRSRS
jgi:hypothetical protein